MTPRAVVISFETITDQTLERIRTGLRAYLDTGSDCAKLLLDQVHVRVAPVPPTQRRARPFETVFRPTSTVAPVASTKIAKGRK